MSEPHRVGEPHPEIPGLWALRAGRALPHHRVRAGDVGAWVRSPDQIREDAWAGLGAIVRDDAVIEGRALVRIGDAVIEQAARIGGDAVIEERARIGGAAVVDGSARVAGEASVAGSAHVSGTVSISVEASASGSAFIDGGAVYGSVGGAAHVSGGTVERSGTVAGSAQLLGGQIFGQLDGCAVWRDGVLAEGRAVTSGDWPGAAAAEPPAVSALPEIEADADHVAVIAAWLETTGQTSAAADLARITGSVDGAAAARSASAWAADVPAAQIGWLLGADEQTRRSALELSAIWPHRWHDADTRTLSELWWVQQALRAAVAA